MLRFSGSRQKWLQGSLRNRRPTLMKAVLDDSKTGKIQRFAGIAARHCCCHRGPLPSPGTVLVAVVWLALTTTWLAGVLLRAGIAAKVCVSVNAGSVVGVPCQVLGAGCDYKCTG
jgi:hypothetical protein